MRYSQRLSWQLARGTARDRCRTDEILKAKRGGTPIHDRVDGSQREPSGFRNDAPTRFLRVLPARAASIGAEITANALMKRRAPECPQRQGKDAGHFALTAVVSAIDTVEIRAIFKKILDTHFLRGVKKPTTFHTNSRALFGKFFGAINRPAASSN